MYSIDENYLAKNKFLITGNEIYNILSSNSL